MSGVGPPANGLGKSSQPILKQAFLPVASPSYIYKHGRPTSPETLDDHLPIQEQGLGLWWSWLEATHCDIADPVTGALADDGAVAMQLALDGQGVCIGVKEFIEDDLGQGRLIALFDPVILSSFAYCLVHRPPSQVRAPVSKFADWIALAAK